MRIKELLILILFSSIFVNTQTVVQKHITAEDGLISDQVRCVFEDSQGYIWFATNKGVSRWDGSEFVNFNEDNGLVSSIVFDITEGTDGTIYFANFGIKGINSLKDGIFDTLFAEANSQLRFISHVNANYDGSLILAAQDGITLYDNGVLLNLHQLYNIEPYPFYNKHISNKGDVYFATGNGVIKYSNKKIKKIIEGSSGKKLFTLSMATDKNDNLWYATEEGVFILENGNSKKIPSIQKNITKQINHFIITSKNIPLFATDSGLMEILPDYSTSFLTTKNGLTSNKIWRLYETANGSIFLISSVSGIDIYNYSKFTNYNMDNGLAGNSVLNILIDDGVKYISTENGLTIFDKNKVSILDKSVKYGYDKLLTLSKYKKGEVLIGSHSGIDIYRGGKLSPILEFEQTRDIQHQGKNYVQSIATFNDSILYVASYKGVYRIENDKFSIITKKDGLLSSFVNTIYVTHDKSVVFGYHGRGISIYKNNEYTHYTEDDGLPDNNVLSLSETNDNLLLIGSESGGLAILNNGRFDTVTVEDGLTSNEIRAIAEDAHDNIYLTTPIGVNVLNIYNDRYFIRTITKEDGLIGNDCNYNSLFIDDSNNVWIGTTSGLSKYNAASDPPLSSASPVKFVGYDIYNEPQLLNPSYNHLDLEYDQNYLNFKYSCINTTAPKKIIYHYKLSGVDKDWVESKNTSVQYTSLNDGEYTFSVKSRNEWGYWSEPAQLSLIINPAWWETWWFYSLSAISIALLIAFLASYRYRHLLAVEKVRTKISADLHDSIGSGLTEITFLSEMVKYQIKQNENPEKGLDNITGISKTLIDDMKDIVWLVNPSKDSLKDLFNRLQDSYQEVLRFSDISLLINGIEKLSKVKLPIAYRQNIFLMFKEAINNSIKYSECKNIVLNVNTDYGKLDVEFKDDGKGFDMDNTKMGNGIHNIKKRAKLVNGTVTIDSNIGQGTHIKFAGNFNKLKITEL